jgi:hypothetical protein
VFGSAVTAMVLNNSFANVRDVDVFVLEREEPVWSKKKHRLSAQTKIDIFESLFSSDFSIQKISTEGSTIRPLATYEISVGDNIRVIVDISKQESTTCVPSNMGFVLMPNGTIRLNQKLSQATGWTMDKAKLMLQEKKFVVVSNEETRIWSPSLVDVLLEMKTPFTTVDICRLIKIVAKQIERGFQLVPLSSTETSSQTQEKEICTPSPFVRVTIDASNDCVNDTNEEDDEEKASTRKLIRPHRRIICPFCCGIAGMNSLMHHIYSSTNPKMIGHAYVRSSTCLSVEKLYQPKEVCVRP